MASFDLCSLTYPQLQYGASAAITNPGPKTVTVGLTSDSSTLFNYKDPDANPQSVNVTYADGIKYIAINSFYPVEYALGSKNYTITLSDTVNAMTLPSKLNAFSTDASKFRNVFNSPETSFGQPSLGSVLKLEERYLW